MSKNEMISMIETMNNYDELASKAKAKGAKIGRPQATVDDIPAVFLRHYPAYKNKQLNVSELARVCDLSRTTVYKYIDLLEG